MYKGGCSGKYPILVLASFGSVSYTHLVDDEYYERLIRESMDYGYPDEKVFVEIAGE